MRVLKLGGIAVLACTAAAALGACGGGDDGGPLAWREPPRSSAVTGAANGHLLFGMVVNRSSEPIRLRAVDVHVVDDGGDELAGTAAFARGFVAGVSLRGYGREMFASSGGEQFGQQVTLEPGQASPLTISFTVPDGSDKPAGIEYGDGRLPLRD